MKINPKLILDTIYPVGSIYINTTNTNPSTFLGGTWEQFGAGKVMVGYNSSETEFNSLLKTGGEKTHTLTINEMPSHKHNLQVASGTEGTQTYYDLKGGWFSSKAVNSDQINATGGGQAHNILQPYIVVSMWKRTA